MAQKRPVEILTEDEVASLVRANSKRAPTGVRNAALVAVMYRGGLRVSEALALRVKDFDTDKGTLRVLRGKGDKPRTVALDETAQALLQRWLDRRQSSGLSRRQRLFSTLDGGPVSTAYIRQLLPRLARRAGIEKRVHPHGLRHSFAAGLMAEGVPVNVISAALGHSSVATTATYLAHIQPQEVIDTLRARSWTV